MTPSVLERVKQDGELVVFTRNSPATYYEGPDAPAGLEYDMAKLFADELGVKLTMIIPETLGDILEGVKEGTAHFAAAGLTVTDERKKHYRFGPAYQEITEQLLYHADNRNYEVTYVVGIDVLSTNLENARPLRFRGRKNRSKIQIMSKDDVPISLCPCHYLAIRRPGIANAGPMYRVPALFPENWYPFGGKIHVDENLHEA